MAHFDKAIPPGGEGKIRLSVRTSGYQGSIQKSARVYTNDPDRNVVRLLLKGVVKAPIRLSPRHVRLYGKEDQILTRMIEVTAELDKPLELTPSHFNLGEKLTYTIEEIEKGRRFQIHFKSMPSHPQAYRGFLKLKTNYPEKPEITIWIRVQIRKKG